MIHVHAHVTAEPGKDAPLISNVLPALKRASPNIHHAIPEHSQSGYCAGPTQCCTPAVLSKHAQLQHQPMGRSTWLLCRPSIVPLLVAIPGHGQPDCPAGPPSLLPAPPPAEHAAPAQLQTSPAQCMAASTVTGASSCSPSKREPDESPLAVAAAAACAGRLLQAEASTCCCSPPHSRCLTDIRTACCIFGGHIAEGLTLPQLAASPELTQLECLLYICTQKLNTPAPGPPQLLCPATALLWHLPAGQQRLAADPAAAVRFQLPSASPCRQDMIDFLRCMASCHVCDLDQVPDGPSSVA